MNNPFNLHSLAKYISYCLIIFALSACSEKSDDEPAIDPEVVARTNTCGTYPEQSTSPFNLPYKIGESYEIMQGNCTTNSHRKGTLGQFAYDFLMPIGTDIIAIRGGTVVAIQESFENVTTVQRPGEENFVIINNGNGTQDRYFHLDKDGVHVSVGDVVIQGQLIGTGGNSGGTPRPHLHLEVIRPASGGGSPIPVTFKNTTEHLKGLLVGETYEAF